MWWQAGCSLCGKGSRTFQAHWVALLSRNTAVALAVAVVMFVGLPAASACARAARCAKQHRHSAESRAARPSWRAMLFDPVCPPSWLCLDITSVSCLSLVSLERHLIYGNFNDLHHVWEAGAKLPTHLQNGDLSARQSYERTHLAAGILVARVVVAPCLVSRLCPTRTPVERL